MSLSIKQQAKQMLDDSRIVEILEKYGNVRLHGAYEMDLMTWPEIDLWVFSDEFESCEVWRLLGDLGEFTTPTHIHVINQLDQDLKKTPPNCISVDYRFVHEEIEWKLDLCIGNLACEAESLAYLDHVVPKLTPEKRASIMAIKELASRSRWYRKSRWNYAHGGYQFVGVEIYRAVLFEGVRTPAEFVTYLKKLKNIDLSQDFGLLPGTFSFTT